MKVVVDTGPLIYLAQLGRLTLLRDLYDPCIPFAVLDEVNAWSSELRYAIQAVSQDWLVTQTLEDFHLRDYLVPQIDLGEAEVIALAVQLGASRVLLDDQDARRSARLYGLQPMGTLGVLLQAKRRNLLPTLRPEIDRLAQTNFYFSESLVLEVLRIAGEVK